MLISQTSKYVDLSLGIKNLYPGYKMKLITIVFDYLGAVLGASEEITQINDETVPENTKKATKFGLALFKGNGLSFSPGVYR